MSRRELEARMRAAVVDEAIAAMRHDLRNHLAAIRNASAYLHRRVERTTAWAADPRVPAFLGLIDDEIRSAARRLDGARLVDPAPARASLAEAVLSALAFVDVPCTIEVRRALAEGWVGADHDELVICAACLLENAIEAAREGVVAVSVRPEGEHLILSVADEGPGFAPDVRDDALRPFVTTKPQRAGLGLAVVARTARRRGGEVRLGEGPGGRVDVAFPASKDG